MHELSIALRIVETVQEALVDERARVAAVNVRVGALSGVVPDALMFAWEMATAETILHGSRLEIEVVPVAVSCPACQAEHELPTIQHLRCPACQAPTARVVRGRELEVVSLEVSDEAPDRGSTDAGPEEE